MFILLAIGVCLLPALSSALPYSTGTKYLFSFGDSYTQTNFEATGTLPAPGNALGNPPYPGGTATGGENWIDYVTTTYNNSLLLTYNYAYGGATIDSTLIAPFDPSIHTLIEQVDIYTSTAGSHPPETSWESKDSLFSIWIGINDIGNSWDSDGDRNKFSDVLLNSEFEQVTRLLCMENDVTDWLNSNTGARNFLFITVPPIDRTPYMVLNVNTAGRQLLATTIDYFNARMTAKALEFAQSDPEINVYFWDSWTSFTEILDNLEAYGFTTDTVAYGNDRTNFWGNNYHPSSYAHDYFGKAVGMKSLGETVW